MILMYNPKQNIRQMKRIIDVSILVLILLNVGFLRSEAQNNKVLDYVNPLIGSHSSPELSCGNTYPTICVPFGMHNWAPHTGKMHEGFAYSYQTNYMQGFRQTHRASLWIKDYGQFSLMPITSINHYTEEKRKSWYSHKTEVVKPNYYKVYLGDPQAYVEMTPTERAAKFRITYNGEDSSYLVLDAFRQGAYVKIIPSEQMIIGYASNNDKGVTREFKNYFVMKFDKPFATATTWDGSGLKNSLLELKNERVGAVISFDLKRGEQVNIDIASSYISDKQALLNLQEVSGKTFEEVKNVAADIWERELGKVKIKGGTDAQMQTFYSALYRMMIFPRKFYEIDEQGRTIHYSPYTGKIEPGYMYADNGFWDTFRTQFPFLTLMYPQVVTEIMKSLENIYKESGWLPEWFSPGHRDCMIGSHSSSVITDAYLNGIKDIDINLLYEAIVKNTTQEGPLSSIGRLGAKYYNKKGYVPYNVGVNQNVSRTLEYAYNDYCIMKLAKALNKPTKEVNLYRQRALNYRNLYDASTRLMRPRSEDGKFLEQFNPVKWGEHFTEGSSWQYTWFVPHDVNGLKNLMGGRTAFYEKMDSIFTMPQTYDISYYKRGIIHLIREMQSGDMGQYSHFNEPMHHVLYMYNFGQPWKTQYWVRKVMDYLYLPTPDGYLGEEDNGQMSAWYVMSTLGLYPLAPCSGQYVLGSPLFKEAELQLPNGNRLTIKAPHNTKENVYVEQVKFNGNNHSQNFIEIERLKMGGILEFMMSSIPNKQRGVEPKDFPYSITLEKK